MKTTDFLNNAVNEDFSFKTFGKNDFHNTELIEIDKLIPNQKVLDSDCLKDKIKGKRLTKPHVLRYNNRLILIDGHHTVIAKKINGQNKVYCKVIEQ